MSRSAAAARTREQCLAELQKMPNVGPSIAVDLWDLGIRDVSDLRTRDPEVMYEQLCSDRGARIDRCMLYVFRAAVYFASTPVPDEDKVKWWRWKDEKPPKRKGRR